MIQNILVMYAVVHMLLLCRCCSTEYTCSCAKEKKKLEGTYALIITMLQHSTMQSVTTVHANKPLRLEILLR